jgi:hypothetical protein
MALAKDERTRKPRPHQYSVERRLQEAREEDPKDLTASTKNIVKMASADPEYKKTQIDEIFNDIVDMKQAGISDEDIIYKVAEHYNSSIFNVTRIHTKAMKQLQIHDGETYSYVKKAGMVPPAEQSRLVSEKEVDVLMNGQPQKLPIKSEVVYMGNNNLVFNDKSFTLSNPNDLSTHFSNVGDILGTQRVASEEQDIQNAASEVGLNEPKEEFSITEENNNSVNNKNSV